jgi:hypothetical protein
VATCVSGCGVCTECRATHAARHSIHFICLIKGAFVGEKNFERHRSYSFRVKVNTEIIKRPDFWLRIYLSDTACLFAGSKYLSSINEIDKSEQKSPPDATGKGISYDWTQKSGDCKYRIFATSVAHHILVVAISFPLYTFAL